MKAFILKTLKIIVPIGIGVYLSWYFISGLTDQEIEQTKHAFYEADYLWVSLGILIAFLSHLSRAYRWRFVLSPLGFSVKLSNAYHAVMSGYVINFTVPRSGEVARAGLLTKYENIPFEKSIATIVVERVIDVLMLGVVVLISGFLQVDSQGLEQITESDGKDSSQLLIILLGIGVVIGIIGLVLYFKSEKVKSFVNEKLKGFIEGLKSIWTMQKKWAYLGHTLFIWASYVGSIWVFAQAFPETKAMTAGCVFGAFVVGAAAIALIPGGIGVYPLWITAVLALYQIEFAAFGIFVWVAQTALIVVLGLLSLFLIQLQSEKTTP